MDTVASTMGELRGYLDEIPCPECHAKTLKIELRYEDTEGTVIALAWPWIVCAICGFEEEGQYE